MPEAWSDRETLRWACREGIPCGVVVPGRSFWGQSFYVDLRVGGPRPQLAIAQPIDLVTRKLRPLRAGDSVRLWSVHDDRPYTLEGFVSSVAVIEGASRPVDAALLRLPYRLLETESRLAAEPPPLRVELATVGPDGPREFVTLSDSWFDLEGGRSSRGGGHLLELSRRTFSFSAPLAGPLMLLAGVRVELRVTLPDLELRTRVAGRVRAVMEWSEHILYGLDLGRPAAEVSAEEHRECLRRAAERLG